MRTVLRAATLVLVLGLVLVAGVYAQDEAEAQPEPVAAPEQAALEGTIVGDRGGAIINYEVELPPDTDVTITLDHWPCMTGVAIGIKVWTPDGLIARSMEATPCTQEVSFNTGDGGPAQIQFYNYLHGVGTYYSIMAEGMELPGAAAPVEEMAEEEMAEAEEEMAEEEMAEAEEEMAEAEEEMAEEEMAEEEMAEEEAMPEAMGMITAEDSLVGNSGGAFNSYELAVEEGMEYEVTLTYGAHGGGEHWNGVGFNVWGPDYAWVAQGKQADFNQLTASFTADGDVVYMIQVYNYNHGITISYTLEAAPIEAE